MDPGLPLLICHLKARRQLRRPPPPRSSLHHWRQTPLWVPAPPPGLPPELPPQCTRSAISRRGASRAVHTRSHRVGVVIVLASGAGSARSSAITCTCNARLQDVPRARAAYCMALRHQPKRCQQGRGLQRTQ